MSGVRSQVTRFGGFNVSSKCLSCCVMFIIVCKYTYTSVWSWSIIYWNYNSRHYNSLPTEDVKYIFPIKLDFALWNGCHKVAYYFSSAYICTYTYVYTNFVECLILKLKPTIDSNKFHYKLLRSGETDWGNETAFSRVRLSKKLIFVLAPETQEALILDLCQIKYLCVYILMTSKSYEIRANQCIIFSEFLTAF